MNNDLTNLYPILKKEFNGTITHYNLENNRELASFLHYNTHNEMFIDTDDEYYHNVNVKNLDTGRESRFFTEGYLYFFPKENDFIKPDNYMTSFSVNRGTKCIKVNENGLFIEKSDLNGNIVTLYYDKGALEEIAKLGYSASSIDYIEENIQRHGIKPDRTIAFSTQEETIIFVITENDEIIEQEQIPKDNSRSSYSVYYEMMKQKGYYIDSMLQEKISGVKK